MSPRKRRKSEKTQLSAETPAESSERVVEGREPQPHGGALKRQKALPAMVQQAHGGQLRRGNPGNRGGGRPRSEIRDRLAQHFDTESVDFLASVVRGDVVQKARWPLAACAPHLKCSNCGEKGQLTTDDPEMMLFAEIEVITSAPVKERIAAAKVQGELGLGQVKEMSADDVRERLKQTLELARARMAPEAFLGFLREAKPLWRQQ